MQLMDESLAARTAADDPGWAKRGAGGYEFAYLGDAGMQKGAVLTPETIHP